MSKRGEDKELQTIKANEVGSLPEGIIDPKNFQLPDVPNPYEKQLAALTRGDYLPRLQLEGSSSSLVKKRLVPVGNWIIVSGKDDFQIIGESLDVLILSHRPKALDMVDKKKVIASYNEDSPEFRRIYEAAQARTKHMLYGLEFLVWVPQMTEEPRFATLFMGNPTQRVAAKKFKSILAPGSNRHCTLGCETLDNGEHVWEAPTISACSTPLKSYPSANDSRSQMIKFVNPPKDTILEEVEESEATNATAGGRER